MDDIAWTRPKIRAVHARNSAKPRQKKALASPETTEGQTHREKREIQVSDKRVNQGGGTAKGTAEWQPNRTGGGKYVAKITTLAGKRVRVPMLDDNGRPLFTDKEKDHTHAMDFAHALNDELRSEATARKNADRKAITVVQFGTQWTSGALFREHGDVNGLSIKKTAKDDRNRLRKYVYPYIGNVAIVDVDDQTIEKTFAKAHQAFFERHKRPMSQATKRHLYMVTHRLFELAIIPGRLITVNPVSKHVLPKPGKEKLYSFLYPDELVDLLGCTDIPIARRVYYAIASYTGLRKGSLRAFTWGLVDFKNLTITNLVNKPDLPVMFAQTDPLIPGLSSLIELLRRYRELRGWPDDDQVIVSIRELGCKKDAEAATLRMDLDCAGIKRKNLFIKSTRVEPLRFHDLRATFITWARRLGKGDGWISDRTGHTTKKLMDRYDRGARSLLDLKYIPFPDITNAIPELADMSKVARLPPPRTKKRKN